MAKRTQRGATTVTEYPILQNIGATQGSSWHSIPRTLSKVNHRLYREHRNYYAQVDLVSNVQQESPIQVYTLAPTWYVIGALRAAKMMHDKAMRDERQLIDQARWYDFRYNLSFDMAAFGPGCDEALAYGLDYNGTPQFHTADELLQSLVVDTNGNNRSFGVVLPTGPNNYNVFQEFDAMGNVDTDTAPAAAAGVAPYDDLMPELNTENMLLLESRGDQPPYNATSWEAVWVKVGELYQTSTGAQSLSTGLFQAPLGLLYLYNYGSAMQAGPTPPFNESRLSVSVLPGTYKGVHSDAL